MIRSIIYFIATVVGIHAVYSCTNMGTVRGFTTEKFYNGYSPGDSTKINTSGYFHAGPVEYDFMMGTLKLFPDGACCANGVQWEIYQIINDTIQCRLYCLESGWSNSKIWQMWDMEVQTYQVVDDTSIRLVKVEKYNGNPKVTHPDLLYNQRETDEWNSDSREYDVRFFPWIWENETDWQEWLKSNGINEDFKYGSELMDFHVGENLKNK